MAKSSSTVVIAAGGTGGHVFPALAVAEQLMKDGYLVVWVGTRAGIEARVVGKTNILLEYITISGVRAKGMLAYLAAPFKLIKAVCQSIGILLRHKPCVVLGLGGFVSGPCGLAAKLLFKPLIIHEQNSIPGTANRLLSIFSTRILTGFPNTLLSKRTSCTGNPVRQEIIQLALSLDAHKECKNNLRILVIGGSQGAQIFNETVPRALAQMSPTQRPLIRHQTGLKSFSATQQIYREYNVDAELYPFIEDMHEVYRWADLVISRAGAISLAELAVIGMASILVPYPHAVDDHQTANAKYLEKIGAALLIPQPEFTAAKLAQVLTMFNQNHERISQMANAARSFGKVNATQEVAQICKEYCA